MTNERDVTRASAPEYPHAHPMADGRRRFEHAHRPPAGTQHAAQPLELAHPDMADVAQAPESGSPADLRQQAVSKREEAGWHRRMADLLEVAAERLEARAAQDEQNPPSEQERIRRLLEGGLG